MPSKKPKNHHKSKKAASIQATLSNSRRVAETLGMKTFGSRNFEGFSTNSQLVGRKKRRIRRIELTYICR